MVHKVLVLKQQPLVDNNVKSSQIYLQSHLEFDPKYRTIPMNYSLVSEHRVWTD